jgi:hypothetical protein
LSAEKSIWNEIPFRIISTPGRKEDISKKKKGARQNKATTNKVK